MWTLRDENGIMKAKISSKLAKTIVDQVSGRWKNDAYFIDSGKAYTCTHVKLYIWKGDRLER